MIIISIGFRCTTDSILDKYNLRNFSGPFSYLLCDFETSLILINTEFQNYFTDIESKNNSNENVKYLPHWRMTHNYYVNNYFTECTEGKDIYNLSRCLIWNHHNTINNEVRNTFKRRIDRVLTYLKNEECVLFHIGKIYDDNSINSFIESLISIINRYYTFNHKIVYVIPFTNEIYDQYDGELFYNNEILYIYLLKTTSLDNLQEETKQQNKKGTPLLDCDHNDKNINWTKLIKNIFLS